VALYARGTQARDGIGRWAFASLVATLAVLYVANATSGAVPPSVTAIALVAIASAVIFPVWAWIADRHRTPIG
jgi:hypothetical protein